MPPFAAFYFDCDSTLSSIEGVDELTRRLQPKEREELLALTKQAMDGHLPLAKIYEERLGVLAPSAEELAAVGRFYIENLVPDAAATITALRSLGKHVGIVSVVEGTSEPTRQSEVVHALCVELVGPMRPVQEIGLPLV